MLHMQHMLQMQNTCVVFATYVVYVKCIGEWTSFGFGRVGIWNRYFIGILLQIHTIIFAITVRDYAFLREEHRLIV